MRLKGRTTIALLVVAALLVIGSVAGMVAAGGEEREEFRMDARYWWEVPPVTAYERAQVREIMVLIFDRYLGADIAGMSPEEFEELGRSIGYEKQREALRLFRYYAEKRGFEVPAGMPIPREEYTPPGDVSYWWELVDPEYRENAIAWAKKSIPSTLRHYWQLAAKRGVEVPPGIPHPEEVDVMRLTPEEYALLLNPPPLPLRLLSIEEMEEMRAMPYVVAVYGRARTYNIQAEIQEWLDELRRVEHSVERVVRLHYTEGGDPQVNHMWVSLDGYLSAGLNMDVLTIDEAQVFASQLYVVISQRAERLGIQDVPVVFCLTKVRVFEAAFSKPDYPCGACDSDETGTMRWWD